MRRMVLIGLVTLAAVGGWLTGIVTAPLAISKEPRFPQLTMDQLNDKQKPLGEQIMKVSSVGLGGPYNPMLRSPVFGQKMFDLLYYLRWQTSAI
jgi:4-carboxymuconolactone decarboxylase